MMTGGLVQIVLTIWLGAHPVQVRLPELYPLMDSDRCYARLDKVIVSLRKRAKNKATKIEGICQSTDARDT